MTKHYKVIVPVVTPLTQDFQLDEGAVERIFNHLYQYDIVPFILGTTGEASSLSGQLKRKYMEKAGRIKKSGIPLYAGISSNCFEESVDFAKYCFSHGADAVVATLPSYYALTLEQMKQYFISLADAIPVPLIIYNIPATTHMSIPIDTVLELSHHPNIIAVKDSERDKHRLSQSIAHYTQREDFSFYNGWAAQSLNSLLGGTSGLVPSTGNLVPHIYEKMIDAAEKIDARVMQEMQSLSDTYGLMYQQDMTLGESIWALKVLMQEEGLCQEHVMPPLYPKSAEDAERLKRIFKEFQQEYPVKQS